MLVKSVESIRFYVRSALFLMTPKCVTATFEISTQFTDHSRLVTLSGKPRIGRAEYFVLLQMFCSRTAFNVGCGPTFLWRSILRISTTTAQTVSLLFSLPLGITGSLLLHPSDMGQRAGDILRRAVIRWNKMRIGEICAGSCALLRSYDASCAVSFPASVSS